MTPELEKDISIGTSIENGYVKLDFGGTLSFLKMSPSEARKMAQGLLDLADIADTLTRLAKA